MHIGNPEPCREARPLHLTPPATSPTGMRPGGCPKGGALTHIASLIEPTGDEPLAATYHGLRLTSAFQPIFSLRHRRTVGYEGLLRAQDENGEAIGPNRVFPLASAIDEVVKLDRLSRYLHIGNFARTNNDNGWLFLNVNPAVVVNGKFYGPFFRELLARHGIRPERIVVEVLESDIGNSDLLEQAIQYYRDLGCLVAIDDFGAGHSNIDRILSLRPDIVKLDRELIVRAEGNRMGRDLLNNLVRLLHEAGCLVVLEGIETDAQAVIAHDTDADFVQGYYFARPAAEPSVHMEPERFDALADLSREAFQHDQRRLRELLTPYRYAVTDAAMAYALGAELESAGRALCRLDRVLRCYVLDERGHQYGAILHAPGNPSHTDSRFAPLDDTDRADWSRRPYFRNAVNEPGRLHISKPYLSVVGAVLNVTLSMAVRRGDTTQVVCCDLYWEDRR